MKKLAIIVIASVSYLHSVELINGWVNLHHVIEVARPWLPQDPVIVEAGAYNGKESCAFKHEFPLAKVYAFEPIPELYKQLADNVRGYEGIMTFPMALSDSIGIAKMYVSSEKADMSGTATQSSSLLAPQEHLIKSPDTVFRTVVQVPTTTLDFWSKEYAISRVDMLWLDMQGYELPALKASPEVLKNVKVILTEVEFVEAYKGQYLYQDVKDWLEAQGFTLVLMYRDDWYGDALFIRMNQ